MCFPTSRCAIGEDGSIVSVQNRIKEVLGSRLVYIGLCNILVKHLVKSKRLVFDSFPLRDNRPGEALNRIVLWRVEYSATDKLVQSMTSNMGGLSVEHAQASIINHLDDRSQALLGQLRRGCTGEGAITKEQRSIFALGQLRGLADRKGSNADGDGY